MKDVASDLSRRGEAGQGVKERGSFVYALINAIVDRAQRDTRAGTGPEYWVNEMFTERR